MKNRREREILYAYQTQKAKLGNQEHTFMCGAKWADEHPNWISVEDELPPRGRTDPYVSVPVITCKIVNRGLHEIGFQRYIFGNGKWEYCDATHWMPMPAPPVVSKTENTILKGGEV